MKLTGPPSPWVTPVFLALLSSLLLVLVLNQLLFWQGTALELTIYREAVTLLGIDCHALREEARLLRDEVNLGSVSGDDLAALDDRVDRLRELVHRSEATQGASLDVYIKNQEDLEQDLRYLREVEIKLLQNHQQKIEVALKTAKLM